MTFHAPLSHWLPAAGLLLAACLPGAASAQTVDEIVQRGRIWEQGPSEALFATPQTPELRQFVRSDIK